LGRATSSISGRAQNHSPRSGPSEGFKALTLSLTEGRPEKQSRVTGKNCGPPFFSEGSRQVEAVPGVSRFNAQNRTVDRFSRVEIKRMSLRERS